MVIRSVTPWGPGLICKISKIVWSYLWLNCCMMKNGFISKKEGISYDWIFKMVREVAICCWWEWRSLSHRLGHSFTMPLNQRLFWYLIGQELVQCNGWWEWRSLGYSFTMQRINAYFDILSNKNWSNGWWEWSSFYLITKP